MNSDKLTFSLINNFIGIDVDVNKMEKPAKETTKDQDDDEDDDADVVYTEVKVKSKQGNVKRKPIFIGNTNIVRYYRSVATYSNVFTQRGCILLSQTSSQHLCMYHVNRPTHYDSQTLCKL